MKNVASNATYKIRLDGLQFVKDMVSIEKEANIHFTYHAYHEGSFGLYKGSNTLPNPANANQLLINLFTQILK